MYSVYRPSAINTLGISSLCQNHQLYADDKTYSIFLFIHPRNFDSSIAHLQTALRQISSCMTADLLPVNSLRLNFSLLVPKKQLSKIDNSSLDTVH